MREEQGKHIIESLQKKWNRRLLLSHALLAFAIAVFLSALIFLLFKTSWLFISVAVLLICVALSFFLTKKIKANDVARFLNAAHSKLEESTQLALQPAEGLNGLQRLQLRRIEPLLSEEHTLPPSVRKRMMVSLIAFFLAVLVAVLLLLFPLSAASFLSLTNNITTGKALVKPEIKLPQIKDVSVVISPPSYTKRKARKQDRFNMTAEQKAVVLWTIVTSKKANNLLLL